MPKLRWGMILLCFLANAINFIDRANLAVAAPSIRQEFGIDAAMMGLVLSGFFWTYAALQLPSGWFIDRVGVRIALGVGVAWWSLATAATSLVRSVLSLGIMRLALGIGEACALPGFAKVAYLWFPHGERGIASAIFDSGSRVGSAVALPFVAWLIGGFGWRASFIVTGIIGLVWVAAWVSLYRDPERHASVSADVLKALQEARATRQQRAATGSVRWADLFRYRTIWGMMLGFFCLNFTVYFFITWFPTYLMQARGFSLAALGTLGMLPALLAIPGGWLGGLVSDALYRHGWGLTAARKSCLVGGLLMSSVITLAVFVQSAAASLALLCLANAALAFAGANIWTLPGEVAPTPAHVASIGAIQNFASNLAGIFISTFTGLMLTITRGSFVVPLCVAGALCILGAASYLFVVGKIEPLPVPQRTAPLPGAAA